MHRFVQRDDTQVWRVGCPQHLLAWNLAILSQVSCQCSNVYYIYIIINWNQLGTVCTALHNLTHLESHTGAPYSTRDGWAIGAHGGLGLKPRCIIILLIDLHLLLEVNNAILEKSQSMSMPLPTARTSSRFGMWIWKCSFRVGPW